MILAALANLMVPVTTIANAIVQTGQHVKPSFGKSDFHNQTTVHPVGLTVLLTMALATLVVKRRWAWLPLFVLACTVPSAQRVIIATIDFNFIRILVMAGVVRVLMKREYRGLRWTVVDRLVIAWAVIGVAAYTLLRGNFGAFVFRAGVAYDALGTYLLLRCWIRSWEDVDRLARVSGLLAISLVIFFIYENSTRNNMFSVFGGVPSTTPVRQGRLRCQGPFVHPILAGAFWVGLLPLVASLWWRRPGKKGLAMTASMAIVIIAFTTASSTPVMGVLATGMGMGLWIVRRQMRPLRWSLAGMLVLLHMVMAAPVWHLISRVGAVGGSTGHHRFLLIDNCIKRWPEWFLLGNRSTAHWGHFQFDVANQFVKEAVRGGILSLVLFVMIIGFTFGTVGRLWRSAGKNRYRRMQAWGFGAALFAHCMMFISCSISHSQQNMLIWFVILAVPTSVESWNRPKRMARQKSVAA